MQYEKESTWVIDIGIYKKEAIEEFMQSVKDLKENLTMIKNNSVEHLEEE